jgi:hypothetical protein
MAEAMQLAHSCLVGGDAKMAIKLLEPFQNAQPLAQDSYYKMKLVTVRDKHKVQCAVPVA